MCRFRFCAFLRENRAEPARLLKEWERSLMTKRNTGYDAQFDHGKDEGQGEGNGNSSLHHGSARPISPAASVHSRSGRSRGGTVQGWASGAASESGERYKFIPGFYFCVFLSLPSFSYSMVPRFFPFVCARTKALYVVYFPSRQGSYWDTRLM